MSTTTNTRPANLPPELPDPPLAPDGMMWVYRGEGWLNPSCRYIHFDREWKNFGVNKLCRANGVNGIHYLEAVPAVDGVSTTEQHYRDLTPGELRQPGDEYLSPDGRWLPMTCGGGDVYKPVSDGRGSYHQPHRRPIAPDTDTKCTKVAEWESGGEDPKRRTTFTAYYINNIPNMHDWQIRVWDETPALRDWLVRILNIGEFPTCGNGHKFYPLELWDCPDCHQKTRDELAAMTRDRDEWKSAAKLNPWKEAHREQFEKIRQLESELRLKTEQIETIRKMIQ